MKTPTENTREKQPIFQRHLSNEPGPNATATIVDNRPRTVYQRQLQKTMEAHSTTKAAPMQRKISPELGRRGNRTGLPDRLKTGIENLSGYAMDDVKVHYNSPKPAQLQAHAYAQGKDIHLGPGQEKHLPHEAWHVVQQKQGRVKPTLQFKSDVNINDDTGLEREADVMGSRVWHSMNYENTLKPIRSQSSITGPSDTFQLVGASIFKKVRSIFHRGTNNEEENLDQLSLFEREAIFLIENATATRAAIQEGLQTLTTPDNDGHIYFRGHDEILDFAVRALSVLDHLGGLPFISGTMSLLSHSELKTEIDLLWENLRDRKYEKIGTYLVDLVNTLNRIDQIHLATIIDLISLRMPPPLWPNMPGPPAA